jgi:hypothetical protein
MWLLGSKCWISDLKIVRVKGKNGGESYLKGECHIVTRESGLAHLQTALQADHTCKEDDALAAFVFSGTDFMPRPRLLGPGAIGDVIVEYVKGGDARAAQLSKIEKEKVWPKRGGRSGACVGYAKEFEQVMNLFRYPAVIKEVDVGDGQMHQCVWPMREWDGFEPNNFRGKWTELIGVDFVSLWESALVANSTSTDEAVRCNVWIRIGRALQPLPFPLIDSVEVPHGAALDFSVVPVNLTHPVSLFNYLAFRDNPLPSQLKTRADAIKTVNHLLQSESSWMMLLCIKRHFTPRVAARVGDVLREVCSEWTCYQSEEVAA